MLLEYIQEALERARYELIEDEEPFYGEVSKLPGVWATGKSLEECRENLREVVEGWIMVRLQKGLPLPVLGSTRLRAVEELKIRG
jgi:predicted RNase H-like HicB family nuclease